MNRNPLELVKENDEQLYNHIMEFNGLALSEGALPAKYKILMALALDAAHGASNGVKSLALQAMKAGATKEEILETVRVAYYISGVGSVYTAAQGLEGIL